MSKIFTVSEVAQYLKVDQRTIRKLIDCEILKRPDHWFYLGKQIRIKEEGLNAILNDEGH